MATESNPPLPNPSSPLPEPKPEPQPPLTEPTHPPKRQRRPSVRLGDIGDQHPQSHRPSKPSWRLHTNNPKSSKTRPLTNLVTNGNRFSKHLHRKKPRTHPHHDDDIIGRDNDVDFHHHDDDEGFKDFDPQGSDNDIDQDGGSDDDVALLDAWHGHSRRSNRGFTTVTTATRASDSRADMGLSDSGNKGGSGSGLGLDDGVRNWLVGLGLGRYSPVFEIHEVDEEVLPYLTLDDLKDMGINAVGTRRKLYFAIQKLRKSGPS